MAESPPERSPGVFSRIGSWLSWGWSGPALSGDEPTSETQQQEEDDRESSRPTAGAHAAHGPAVGERVQADRSPSPNRNAKHLSTERGGGDGTSERSEGHASPGQKTQVCLEQTDRSRRLVKQSKRSKSFESDRRRTPSTPERLHREKPEPMGRRRSGRRRRSSHGDRGGSQTKSPTSTQPQSPATTSLATSPQTAWADSVFEEAEKSVQEPSGAEAPNSPGAGSREDVVRAEWVEAHLSEADSPSSPESHVHAALVFVVESDMDEEPVLRLTESAESKRRSIKVSHSEKIFAKRVLVTSETQNDVSKDATDSKWQRSDERARRPEDSTSVKPSHPKGRIADKISLFERGATNAVSSSTNLSHLDVSPARNVASRLRGFTEHAGSRSSSAPPTQSVKERALNFSAGQREKFTAPSGRTLSEGRLKIASRSESSCSEEPTAKTDTSGEPQIKSKPHLNRDQTDSKSHGATQSVPSLSESTHDSNIGNKKLDDSSCSLQSVSSPVDEAPQVKSPTRTSTRSKKRRGKDPLSPTSKNKQETGQGTVEDNSNTQSNEASKPLTETRRAPKTTDQSTSAKDRSVSSGEEVRSKRPKVPQKLPQAADIMQSMKKTSETDSKKSAQSPHVDTKALKEMKIMKEKERENSDSSETQAVSAVSDARPPTSSSQTENSSNEGTTERMDIDSKAKRRLKNINKKQPVQESSEGEQGEGWKNRDMIVNTLFGESGKPDPSVTKEEKPPSPKDLKEVSAKDSSEPANSSATASRKDAMQNRESETYTSVLPEKDTDICVPKSQNTPEKDSKSDETRRPSKPNHNIQEKDCLTESKPTEQNADGGITTNTTKHGKSKDTSSVRSNDSIQEDTTIIAASECEEKDTPNPTLVKKQNDPIDTIISSQTPPAEEDSPKKGGSPQQSRVESGETQKTPTAISKKGSQKGKTSTTTKEQGLNETKSEITSKEILSIVNGDVHLAETEDELSVCSKLSSSNENSSPTPASTIVETKPPSDSTKEKTKPPSDSTKEKTKPPSDSTNEKTKPPQDSTKEKTKPPSDSTNEKTKPPQDSTKEKTKPPSDSTNEKTTPPSDSSKEKTKPPSDSTKEKTTPPSDSTNEKTTPPSDSTNEKTTPPSDSSKEKTTASSDSTKEKTTPPSDSTKEMTTASSDSSKEKTTPPSDSTKEKTTPPSDSTNEKTTPPSDSSKEKTKPPSDSTKEKTTPPSDSSKEKTKPPSDSSKEKTTPPSDSSKEKTKPPSDSTKEKTTPPSDSSKEKTKPPSDSTKEKTTPPSDSTEEKTLKTPINEKTDSTNETKPSLGSATRKTTKENTNEEAKPSSASISEITPAKSSVKESATSSSSKSTDPATRKKKFIPKPFLLPQIPSAPGSSSLNRDSPSSWLDVDHQRPTRKKQLISEPKLKLNSSVSETNLNTSGESDPDDFIANVKRLAMPFNQPQRKHNKYRLQAPPFAMPAIREDHFEKPFDPEEFQLGLRRRRDFTFDLAPGSLSKSKDTEAKEVETKPKWTKPERESILSRSLIFQRSRKRSEKEEEEKQEGSNKSTTEPLQTKSRLERCSIVSILRSPSKTRRTEVLSPTECASNGLLSPCDAPGSTTPPQLAPTAETPAQIPAEVAPAKNGTSSTSSASQFSPKLSQNIGLKTTSTDHTVTMQTDINTPLPPSYTQTDSQAVLKSTKDYRPEPKTTSADPTLPMLTDTNDPSPPSGTQPSSQVVPKLTEDSGPTLTHDLKTTDPKVKVLTDTNVPPVLGGSQTGTEVALKPDGPKQMPDQKTSTADPIVTMEGDASALPPLPSFDDVKLPGFLDTIFPKEPKTAQPSKEIDLLAARESLPIPGLVDMNKPLDGAANKVPEVVIPPQVPAAQAKLPNIPTSRGIHRRPGKITIFELHHFNGQSFEIYRDQPDATHMQLSSVISIKVVRGCWVLYEKPGFEGRCIALEEEVVVELPNQWGEEGEDASGPVVIGSIRQAVSDYTPPRIELFTEPSGRGRSSEFMDLTQEVSSFSLPQNTGSIKVHSGLWLVYSDPGFQGLLAVLEAGEYPVPEAWGFPEPTVGSLRPLRMGGLRVEKPNAVKAVLYEKAGFKGRCVEVQGDVMSFTGTETDLSESENHSLNGVESLKILGGLWVGYDREGFEGQQFVLEEGEYLDWSDWGGTSQKLLSLRPLLTDFSSPHVKMFSELDFSERGVSMDLLEPLEDMASTHYGDQTRSIEVLAGVWLAFEDPGFSGQQYVLEKGLYGSPEDWGASRSRISSIIPVTVENLQNSCHFQIQMFSEPEFGGTSVVLQDSLPTMPEGFTISSCRVMAGSWQVFTAECFSGHQCVLEEGVYPDLRTMGFTQPNASVLSVQPTGHEFSVPSVALFERCGLRGRRTLLKSSSVNLQLTDSCTRVSSVLVEGGMWVLYEDNNFRGSQFLLKPGAVPDWPKLSSWHRIGSLRPLIQKQRHFRLRSKETGLLMSVTGSPEDIKLTRIQVSEETDGAGQIWTYKDGHLQCKWLMDCCVDVASAVLMSGSRAVLSSDPSRRQQLWNITADGIIRSSSAPHLVLEVKGGQQFDKKQIILNDFHPNKLNQRWTLEIL